MTKVSVICAVKNRAESLSVVLHSWLRYPEIDEVVIVDWSSDKEIKYLLDEDSRVKVIRVDDQKYFHLAGAYNLAADFVQNDVLLKLDADYILTPYYSFFKTYQINGDEFLTGFGSSKQSNIFYKSLSGFIFIYVNNFKLVHGYNEYLNGWGYDDFDLYLRLEKQGLKHKTLQFKDNCVIHLPHPVTISVKNYEMSDRKVSGDNNYRIAKEEKYTRRLLKWEVIKQDTNYKKARLIT